MKKKKSTAIALIWFLIYLVIIPTPLSNYVLCIGADGHVKFEVAANGRCTDAHAFDSKHAAVMFTDTTPEAAHCGACIDLAIFTALAPQPYVFPATHKSVHPSISVVALGTHQTDLSTILISTPLFGFPRFANPTLRALRTTILLI